jgi:hypothetical protein
MRSFFSIFLKINVNIRDFMKRILLLVVFINILTTFGYSQIQIGGEQPKQKKEKPSKVKKEPNDSAVYSLKVFLGTTFSSTYRTLEPNKNDLFADSLGPRAGEVRRPAWAFHLGFSNDISKYFMWEAGVSFLQNGERYDFAGTDTSHNYTSKYSWIGMPLKVYFKYDIKKFRLQLGGGIVPQMQMKFRREDAFVNSEGTESTIKTKTINGMNTFGVSAIGNVGFHYNITNRFGVYLLFEYRHQLTSSYLKTNSYIHKGNAIGANFGFTFGL